MVVLQTFLSMFCPGSCCHLIHRLLTVLRGVVHQDVEGVQDLHQHHQEDGPAGRPPLQDDRGAGVH